MATRTRQQQRSEPEPEEREGREPDVSLSFGGSGGAKIEASIWVNEVQPDKGDPYKVYTTRIQRSYYVPGEKGQKGHMENTQSFRKGDLLVVAWAAQRALEWIEADKAQDSPL